MPTKMLRYPPLCLLIALQTCWATPQNPRLSVVRYETCYDKIVKRKYFFFKHKPRQSPNQSALQTLKVIHAVDRKHHYGFYLLSHHTWKKAHQNPPHTAPADRVTYAVDFYPLKKLQTYFQDPDTPANNITLLHDLSPIQYQDLQKAFRQYLQDRDDFETVPPRKPWLIAALIAGLMALLAKPFKSRPKKKTSKRRPVPPTKTSRTDQHKTTQADEGVPDTPHPSSSF